jgi:hypothetical protein
MKGRDQFINESAGTIKKSDSKQGMARQSQAAVRGSISALPGTGSAILLDRESTSSSKSFMEHAG